MRQFVNESSVRVGKGGKIKFRVPVEDESEIHLRDSKDKTFTRFYVTRGCFSGTPNQIACQGR